MPSNYTKNYQLNQWEAEDKVVRTDFNADNAKIDAALGTLAAAVERKAEASALTSTAAAIPKIVSGTYTGNGAASKLVNIGFTPKVVYVITQDGYSHTTNMIFGGMALPDSPAKLDTGSDEFLAVSIVDQGFRVYYDSSNNYYKAYANIKDRVYHYLAIG